MHTGGWLSRLQQYDKEGKRRWQPMAVSGSTINKARGGGNQWLSAKILATYHRTFTPKNHI
jgi:hypothetical protein